jgi:hypothetical protein
MLPYLHIGNTPAYFDAGWADVGIGEEGRVGGAALTRFSNNARTQSAEILLASMALGGIFARHPKLTVFVAELWASRRPGSEGWHLTAKTSPSSSIPRMALHGSRARWRSRSSTSSSPDARFPSARPGRGPLPLGWRGDLRHDGSLIAHRSSLIAHRSTI